jgi:quinol monooxygenase YgiN
MIFITAKFTIKPEFADSWPQISGPFTTSTRAEPGCMFFEWSRSVEDPQVYVLIEAFRDGDAGGAHVGSAHFKQAQQDLPGHLVATPQIISQSLDQDDWNELGELAVK